jgi:peroxiredoxin
MGDSPHKRWTQVQSLFLCLKEARPRRQVAGFCGTGPQGGGEFLQYQLFVNASIVGIGALGMLILTAGGWLGWQLFRQNGRILLRLEEMEKRFDELEFEEVHSSVVEPANHKADSDDQSLSRVAGSAGTDRFSNPSLARSKIKRDGLKGGTPAPDFRLPRLDGRGALALSDLRGRRVLLVFSSPGCGPCDALAPELEKFHRGHPELEVVMVSKGEPKENRAKVREHGLSFPIVLQQQWEISRRYAIFATPIAYLIDEQGILARDVAVGLESIKSLLPSGLFSFLGSTKSGELPLAAQGSR